MTRKKKYQYKVKVLFANGFAIADIWAVSFGAACFNLGCKYEKNFTVIKGFERLELDAE